MSTWAQMTPFMCIMWKLLLVMIMKRSQIRPPGFELHQNWMGSSLTHIASLIKFLSHLFRRGLTNRFLEGVRKVHKRMQIVILRLFVALESFSFLWLGRGGCAAWSWDSAWKAIEQPFTDLCFSVTFPANLLQPFQPPVFSPVDPSYLIPPVPALLNFPLSL